ncbi:hypothetical protein JCM6882_003913 [Rhodosporidiobolus microsporus]
MSTIKNYAAVMKEPQARFVVEETSLEQPAEGEVLIKVHAVSINPVDWKVQDTGVFISQYPAVLGADVAGIVEAVGQGVTHVKPGDHALGYTQAPVVPKNAQAGFQNYALVDARAVSPIPPMLSFEAASVLPLSIATAAQGLYAKDFLALPFPKADAPNVEGRGKVLLVWGGSSSNGATAVQFAVASGVRVVATASPANFEFVKSLGASVVFDYRDEKIVELLLAELQKDGEEFAGVYDAIAEHGSVEKSAEVAGRVQGGKKFVAAAREPPKHLPHGVKSAWFICLDPIQKNGGALAKAIYDVFVPAALANGTLKAKPDPLVVGKGLDSIQLGLDRQKAGVSAQKVVVSIV